MIEFHPITPEYNPAFWRLYKRCYEPIIRMQFGGWDEAGHKAHFERIWQHANLQAIVLGGMFENLSDGQPIGCICVSQHADRHELVEIQIDPDFQNRGIATHIIRLLVTQAEQQGKPRYLDVLHANEAQRLYQRLGFAIVETTQHQHRMVYCPST